MLKIEREKNPDAEFVFIRSHQPISSFYKAWKSACDRAKLPGLLFHDFRRTEVRNLVRAGVPERVAMAISGHKTQAVFKRYSRWRTTKHENSQAVRKSFIFNTRSGYFHSRRLIGRLP